MWSEINEIRRRAGLPLLEMSYQDAVEVFAQFGINVRNMDKDKIKQAHRRLIQKQHTDKGGSLETAQDLNAARDALIKGEQVPSGPRSYQRPTSSQTPTWAWAGHAGGMPPSSQIYRENYRDLNYIKKRMWELSGKSKKEYTVQQFDGTFFRNIFTAFGSRKIFNEMAKAMKIWGESGNPYDTRAIFISERRGKKLYLVYLDGKFLGDDPYVFTHDSFNMNPANDQQFVRNLPGELDRVNQKLKTKAGRSERSE